MAATKRERLDEIMKRIRADAPYRTGVEVRAAVERIMKDVEDELSGIPGNPDAAIAPSDGRMYPPHDKYERRSTSSHVRIFKQARHLTFFGNNGALKIVYADGTVELDLFGIDGRFVADFLLEPDNELN